VGCPACWAAAVAAGCFFSLTLLLFGAAAGALLVRERRHCSSPVVRRLRILSLSRARPAWRRLRRHDADCPRAPVLSVILAYAVGSIISGSAGSREDDNRAP
jgi:hypothetical protein